MAWRLWICLLYSITGVLPHSGVITPAGGSEVRAVNQDEKLKGCLDDATKWFKTFLVVTS